MPQRPIAANDFGVRMPANMYLWALKVNSSAHRAVPATKKTELRFHRQHIWTLILLGFNMVLYLVNKT
jgi:hypothetical protein